MLLIFTHNHLFAFFDVSFFIFLVNNFSIVFNIDEAYFIHFNLALILLILHLLFDFHNNALSNYLKQVFHYKCGEEHMFSLYFDIKAEQFGGCYKSVKLLEDLCLYYDYVYSFDLNSSDGC